MIPLLEEQLENRKHELERMKSKRENEKVILVFFLITNELTFNARV